MWHGGRDLEYNYREFKESRKKRWEYGPGLYLTDHYDTASKYAKGGGKTYLVEFEVKNFINNRDLSVDDVFSFIKSYVVKSKARDIMDDIDSHIKRLLARQSEVGNGGLVGSRYGADVVNAEIFLNLMINYDAVIGKNTKKLNEFLVNSGVDCLYSSRFGGRDETILCLFNNKNIKKISVVSASEIGLEHYNLNILQKLKDLELSEKNETLNFKVSESSTGLSVDFKKRIGL